MKLDSALGITFYFKLSDPQKSTNIFLRKHFCKNFQNYRIMLHSHLMRFLYLLIWQHFKCTMLTLLKTFFPCELSFSIFSEFWKFNIPNERYFGLIYVYSTLHLKQCTTILITFTWVIIITTLKICKHFLYAQYIQFPKLPVASNFPQSQWNLILYSWKSIQRAEEMT